MANDKLKSDSLHLEPLDLGALDDFLPDGQADDKKGAVRRFASGFKNGFLEQTKTKTMMRRFLRTALPDGYNRAIAAADDTAETLKQIGYDLEQKHYEELDQISGALQNALPKIKGKTSERLYAKLEKSLRERREGYANTREYSKDPAEAARQRAAEADESAIREALDGSNALNVELAVAQEEAATERAINESQERGLRDAINKDRFDVMSRALSSIVVAQQKQVAFQDQITYRYQRKGLELQFRTFMAIRDLRTMQQAQLKMHQEAFTALVKNTGIPDHLKSTKAEQAAWVKQQQGGGRLTKRVYNSIPGLMANFAPGMAENLSQLGGGAIQRVAAMLSGGEQIPLELLKQQFNSDRAGFVGNMAGKGTSMALQSLLIPMLARRSRGGIKRFSDEKLQGRHNQLSHFFDNAPAMLQEFANNSANSNGTKGYLQKAIRALVPQFALNDQVKDGNYQTIGKQAAFNQLTQRSIVEIIPGYLARILQATRQLKAGQEQAGLETYDITRGEFVAKATAEGRLTKKIVGGSNTRNISWALNTALDNYDSEGKLSKEARHALSERLLRDASTNKHFDAGAYASEEGYAPGTDSKITGELNQFFRSKFKLDADGKMVASASNFAKQKKFGDDFVNIRNMTADPIGEINRLLETGNIGSLRAIGIVITADGQDKINYNRLWELYREGVTDGNANPSGPDAEGGPSGGGPAGGGPLSLKAQLQQARDTIKKHVDVVRGDARAAYDRYSPGAKDIFNDGRSRLTAAYAGSRFAPMVAGARGRLAPHLLTGRQYGQNLLGQAHEAAMPLLQSMPAQEARKLLAQLPEVPQVNKASLLAKIQQAKNGVPPRLSEAEQHLMALVAEHGPKVQAQLQAVRGSVQSGLQSLGGRLGLPGPLAMPDMAVWHKRAQDVAQRLQGHAQPLLDQAHAKVQDLYVKGKDQVAITAEELRSGELIDVTTQKVIQSIDDIKGTVIDKSGKIRLRASELKAGLTDVTGKAIAMVSGAIDAAEPHVTGFLNAVRSRIKGLFTEENGVISRVKDLYLESSREPILLARDMTRGIYLDVNTQKTIETVDDITGPVANAETQEILVTSEDIQKGFTDVNGVKVTSSKLLRYAKSWAWFATRPVMLAFRTLKWATTKAAKGLYKTFFHLDAYLPPGKEPVLTARKLKRGEYFNGEGKLLTSFEDLRDGVYDSTGQVVVEADDVPNLVNRDGTKHEGAKRRWAVTKFAKRMAKGAFKGAAGAYWRGTKKYYNWLGRKMDDPFNKKVNPETGESEEVADPKKLNSPTDRLLAKINETLRDRLPGKGPAKGSAEAQLAAEEAEDAAHLKEERDKRAARVAGAHGGGVGGLGDLAKLLHGKAGDDEEDGGDTNINIEGSDKDRKGRRRKPKGKFGKWLGKSKLGRAAGWLGRGVAGAATMGAEALLGSGAIAAIGSGLSAAGGLLGGGLAGAASLAGSAVAGAGSLLLGALTSPVLLGAAAIGAVAYGGYWLWSRNQNVSGDLKELRLLQYGSNSTSLSLKILEAEAIMESVTSKSATPDWTLNKDVAEKVMKAFGVGKDEPAKIAALATWMDKRMKPVMMAWIAAVANLAQGNIPLGDLDDKFPAPQKLALLDAVKLPAGADGPYGCLVDPTGDTDPLEVTPGDIEKKFAALKDTFASLPTNAGPKSTTALPAGAAAATVAGVNTARNGVNAQPSGTTGPSPGPVANAQASMTKLGAAGVGVAALKGASVAITSLKGGIISALQSIRMRAYGLDTVDTKNVTALLSAESYMFKGITYNRDGDAEWGGDPETLVQDLGPYFGVSATDPTDKDRVAFVKWVYYRFSPAFLAFLSAAHKADSSISTLDAIEKMPASQKVQIANAVMTATADFDGDKQSIWTQPHIFPGNASASTLKDMAKKDLDVLSQEAEKEKLSTPTQSAQQQAAKAGSGSSSNAGDSGGGIVSRMGEAISSFGSSIASTAGKAWEATKNFFGGGDKAADAGPNAGAPYVAGKTPTFGGPLVTGGNVYEGFAKGTGGAFETIPLPSSNKSRDAAMATLKAIEAMTGISAELLATFCSIESGFDYLIKAPTSSATGWFQFINDTWDDMIKRFGSKYGIPPDDAQRSHRKDPRINGLMGAEFLKENAGILSKALGRAPSDVDLYCAHFFGAYTAAKFLKMDPNAIAALAFPKQADANKSIFYKGPGAPRTIREVYALLEEKVSKHRKGGKGTNLLMQTGGKEMSPVDAANAQAAAVAGGETAVDAKTPATATAGGPASAGGESAALAAVASGSKAPLSMPGASGSGTPVSSGASPTAADNGIGEPQVGDDAATTAAKAATKADRLKAAQTQDHMDAVKQGTDLQAQQLAVQSEMRDYLKVIANQLTSGGSGAGGGSGNGMENTASGAASRVPSSTRAPISMSK